jgi:hypothetical protein
MTHDIDINGVQSVEIEPVFPNMLAAQGSKRYGRRILVRTQFGVTTINLHAASEGELLVAGVHPPAPPSGGPGSGVSQGHRNKR